MRIENEIQTPVRSNRGQKEAHQNVLIVEQTAKQQLQGLFCTIQILDDNSASP